MFKCNKLYTYVKEMALKTKAATNNKKLFSPSCPDPSSSSSSILVVFAHARSNKKK
jgi:hypothetical protein